MISMKLKYEIIFCSIIILLIFMTGDISTRNVSASPSFPEQFIDGSTSAYFPDGYFEDKTNALSLEGAYYKSNGKSVDTRLILHGFNGFSINSTLSFGMLIDSDSDFNTGKGGFDYRYRVVWDDGEWFEILEELSTSSINLKEILKKQIESPFFPDSVNHNGLKSLVELSLDLEHIGNPDLFTVVFFTEGQLTGETLLIQDVLSLAVIPPPTFTVKTEPSLISFESSTEKIIHIIVKSDITETTDLHYNVYSDSDSVEIKQLIGNSVSLKEGTGEIPILLLDEGHDDLKIHNLFVDLNPWYPVNPETKSIKRGSEIYETYHFRNQQKADTFTLFWSSLPQKPLIDTPLGIQITLLIATGIMAGFGIWTHFDNRRFGNQERKIRHTNEMAKIYKIMLSSTSDRDYHSKKLVLRYPSTKENQAILREETITQTSDSTIESMDLNNILHLSRAIKHMKKYDEVFQKWNLLQTTIDEYNQNVISLKNEIKTLCLEKIKEKLPEFREYDGGYTKAFFINSIIDESYEILFDGVKDIPHQPIWANVYPWNPDNDNDERKLYVLSVESTLFQSPEPINQSIVDNILNSSINDKFRKQMEQIFDTFEKAQSQLSLFKYKLSPLVKKLEGEDLIAGKCDLKI